DEDGVDLRDGPGGRQPFGGESDLAVRRALPVLLRGTGTQLAGGVGVEVAVSAPGRTERDVQVDPERGGPRAGPDGLQPVRRDVLVGVGKTHLSSVALDLLPAFGG